MSKEIRERLAEWRKGLVCLVPKETAANAMSITCHEKTLCDCKVLEIIATLETTLTKLDTAVEALESISANTYGTELCNTDEENNEILASHYFVHQNIGREALAKIKGEK